MSDVISPPPIPKMLDYPAAVSIAVAIIGTTLLLYVSGRFDPSGGMLTISLLVVLAFIATVVFTLFFTVPSDEITAAVIGGLVAAFGAVIAFWLGKRPPDPK